MIANKQSTHLLRSRVKQTIPGTKNCFSGTISGFGVTERGHVAHIGTVSSNPVVRAFKNIKRVRYLLGTYN